jgi:acyl-CoA thioester hydrolase
MGVVYYANYFVWFEIARTEHFRSLGISYRELEAKGFHMMVASAKCDYKSPTRYDDVVRIESSVTEMRSSSMKFDYKLFVNDRLVASGDSAHVFTNTSGRPVRIPEEVRNLISK